MAYRVTLDFWFVTVVSKVFGEYREPDLELSRLVESSLLLLAAGIAFPRKMDTPSKFYYSMLLMAVVVPMTTLYTYSEYPSQYLWSVIVTVALMRGVLGIEGFRFPYIVKAESIVAVFLFLIVSGSVLWLIYSTGGRFVIDFSEIYIYRIENRATVSVGLWGYLISWTGKVIVPFFIALSLYKKSSIGFCFFLSVQFLVFSLSTHKLYIVLGLFPILAYKILDKREFTPGSVLSLIVGALVGLYFLYAITGNVWIPALTVQRAILKPAYLNFIYAEYFSGRDLVMLSNSFLGILYDNPYNMNPGFLVGEYLRGTPGTRSNTGFLGTAVAHFGFIGPPLFGVIVALILRVLDTVGRSYPLWFVLSVTFGGVSSLLISADLLPSLNTQGILLSILILLLMRNSVKKNGQVN